MIHTLLSRLAQATNNNVNSRMVFGILHSNIGKLRWSPGSSPDGFAVGRRANTHKATTLCFSQELRRISYGARAKASRTINKPLMMPASGLQLGKKEPTGNLTGSLLIKVLK